MTIIGNYVEIVGNIQIYREKKPNTKPNKRPEKQQEN